PAAADTIVQLIPGFPHPTSSAMLGMESAMKWIAMFTGGCVVLTGLLLLLIWGLSGFGPIGLSGGALLALILGAFGMSLLCAVLMALVFYSDRSGQDEAVRNSSAGAER